MDREAVEIDLTGSNSESPASAYGDPGVEFDEWKEDILACLDGIKSSGDFSISRKYPIHVNPCLQIAGQETAIPLPLTDGDAETIRGACREAPFGKGDETLVDTSVRKTWELDATRFQCTNPTWPSFLDSILRDVAAGFGLPAVKVKPHKLLLYEKGSFFKRHKDSEKEAGMVATLVVCLPGIHRGGDVHLSFGSEKRQLATAPASRFDVTAMAWFSDVDHEVKPLESGNRLVLTYKLFQTSGPVQSAQLLFGQSQRLKTVLSRWPTHFADRPMLAYPLDHLYTKSSLSMNNLKGRDRAVCHSLKEMSAAYGLYLTLAHMTRSETDDCDGYFDSIEPSIELQSIYSCDGAKIGSYCTIEEYDILGSHIFEREPDSEDEGEFTGNENMPAAFRYHNTVAVLTPMHQLPRYLMTSNWGLHGDRADNFFSMVKKTFEEHRENAVVKSNTLQVMANILGANDSSLSRIHFAIAKWAMDRNYEDLFQKALQTLLSSKAPRTEVLGFVSILLNEAYANNVQEINWNNLFGPFLQSSTLGPWELFTKSFAAHLKVKAIQDSFILWAQSQLAVKLSAQASFDVNDHDFFLDTLCRSTEDDRILAAFRTRGTRELIYKVLDSMFQRKEQYEGDRLKSIFETTLEVARSRLVLRKLDICAKRPGSHFDWLPDYDEYRVRFRQFAGLVKQSLAVGACDQAVALVEGCYKELCDARSSWDPSRCHKHSLAQDLLLPLGSAFYSHNVSPTPSIKSLFELLIRDVLHYGMPAYPERPSGWRHKRRGCGHCGNCAEMNAFLVSEDQQSWRYCATGPNRKHVEAYLPDSIFKKQTITGRSPYTLVVEKRGTEHREEVAAFSRKLQQFDSVLSPLQGVVFRSILGEETYQDIVALERIRSGTAPAPLAGVRRPAESELAGDSARQRL